MYYILVDISSHLSAPLSSFTLTKKEQGGWNICCLWWLMGRTWGVSIAPPPAVNCLHGDRDSFVRGTPQPQQTRRLHRQSNNNNNYNNKNNCDNYDKLQFWTYYTNYFNVSKQYSYCQLLSIKRKTIDGKLL